jgi:hypothetical protein
VNSHSLEAIVKAEGPLIDSPQGRKAHPAAVELRAVCLG